MGFAVRHDFERMQRHMASMRQQHRFAMAGAINDVLFSVRGAVVAGTAVFDRPTEFTRHSPRVVKATKADLTGAVVIPTESGAGALTGGAYATLPAGKPLLAEVQGGPRRFKRSEVLLHRKGILPRGMYAVPGPAAEIDAYGNMQRGQILHLLSYLQAFGPTARSGKALRSNMGDVGRAKLKRGAGVRARRFGTEYFVVSSAEAGKGLRPGVYARKAAIRRTYGPAPRVRAVLFFVTSAQYRELYRFHDIAERAADAASFADRYQARLAHALATAREV